MMELYRGRGLYLLCQLPLASRFDVEPMAGEVLARIVAYAAGAEACAQPVRSLAAVTAPAGAVAAVLQKGLVRNRRCFTRGLLG